MKAQQPTQHKIKKHKQDNPSPYRLQTSAINVKKVFSFCILLIFTSTIYANAQWNHKYHVDQFGDPTEQDYIGTIVDGTFSDGTTSNGALAASIRISHRDGEYLVKFHMLKNKKGPAQPLNDFTLSIKNSSNDVKAFEGKNGVLISKSLLDFLAYLEIEKTGLKFALIETSADNAKYLFNVDFDNFELEMQKLSLSSQENKDIELGGIHLGAPKTKKKTKTSYARIVGHVYAAFLDDGTIYSTRFIPLGIMLTSTQKDEVLEFTNTRYNIDLEKTNTESGTLATYSDTKYGALFVLSKTSTSFTLEISDINLKGNKK